MNSTIRFSSVAGMLILGLMGSAQASPYNSAVLSSGPAFYWTFDEASGNAIDQVAGLAADDLVPGSTAARGASTNTAGGVSLGTAATFTGTTNQEFQANDLTGAGGTTKWAVEFWAQSSTTNTYQYLMGGANSGNRPAFMQWGNDNSPSAVQYYPDGGGVQSSAGAPAASTSWQHFVFVVDSDANAAAVYVNGGLWGNQTLGNPADPLPYGKWTVGSWTAGAGSELFKGSVDEVAIYDLSNVADIGAKGLQIASHYNVSVPEPSALLLIGMGLAGMSVVGRRRSKCTV